MLLTNADYMYGTIYDRTDKMALNLKIGDCISFGSFVPDIDGCEVKVRVPMIWHVIDRKDNKLKLLSYFFFEHIGFWSVDYSPNEIMWGNTEIRKDLNEKFFSECFSESEQKAILTTEVKTNNSNCVTTQDKLYVPSLEDIKNIPEHLKIGRGLTIEKDKDNVPTIGLTYCFYWLRDPSEYEGRNLVVQGYANSQLVIDDLDYYSDEVGVRAVMWVDAEKLE